MIPQSYEIRLQGSLSPALRSVFAPMQCRTEADGRITVLTGVIHDQSELSGVLAAIDNLGLVLLEVRPTAAA